jgi:hypothetical protein
MAATAVATLPPEDVLHMIRAEFEEMPGMRLSIPQIRRLWHLEEREGQEAIDTLVATGVLAHDESGRLCLARELSV